MSGAPQIAPAGTRTLDARMPSGPMPEKWDKYRFDAKLVNPTNRRKFTVIVVGTGLAGGAAAATLGEAGYNVLSFCIQDSPRRAHSIAAQGGINAAKNYRNDGDSITRLFYDTVKGGDYRAREGNVYRLAQVSNDIIDQCVAQGVPFAREYGGQLDNRSFGGAQVSRTFYARGQTGQQLLIGAYQAMMRQVGAGTVKLFPRYEMLDLVVVDGCARGIIARNLNTGKVERFEMPNLWAINFLLAADSQNAVHFLYSDFRSGAEGIYWRRVNASGTLSAEKLISTNAVNSNATAIWRAYKRGALFANPCFTQIHPTCIPMSGEHQSKLTLMSESLRNDGRIWVPKAANDKRAATEIPEADRDYFLERRYPTFGNLVPRDVASRASKAVCDEGRGVGSTGLAVFLDFADSIKRLGEDVIRERYGNLFQMYEKITDENPYKTAMRIYPAIHYTMGGLWVDYHLMSTIPGLFVLGEANFSDHGANRLGASALMQGLADGYFVAPSTLPHYLASSSLPKVTTDHEAFREAESSVQAKLKRLTSVNGKKTPREIHRALGKLMWDRVGMGRNDAGLKLALKGIPELREQFWREVAVPSSGEEFSQILEYAGRVADYLELSELIALDARGSTPATAGCRFATSNRWTSNT